MSEIHHQLLEAIEATRRKLSAEEMEREALRQTNAETERKEKFFAFSQALRALPDYLLPFFKVEESDGTPHDVYLYFDFAELAAPIIFNVVKRNREWAVWGYRVRQPYMGDDGPVYDNGVFTRDPKVENALILADDNGKEFARLAAQYQADKEASALIEAAQQQAEPVQARARAAQKAYALEVLAAIQSDPVLKAVLDILFAVATERAASWETLREIEWAQESEQDARDVQERQARQRIDQLAQELREAQLEAQRADEEVEEIKRKVRRL